MSTYLRGVLWLLPALVLLAGCGMPRDPENTLKNIVNEKRLRVGVIEDPPFVRVRDDGQVAGAEAEIVRQLAGELGAEVEWVPGAGSSLMEALGKRELDVVIGGVTDKTPWKKHVGTSHHYLKTAVRVGVPPGAEPPETVKDLVVAVDKESPALVMHLREKGGIPREIDGLHAALTSGQELPKEAKNMPVAAEDWRLESWGYVASEEKLHEQKHILALPQGENAWIVEANRFLTQKLGEAKARQLLLAAAKTLEATSRP